MPEPTLALTFEDYIKRVAEYLGVAEYSGGVIIAPTDTHNLEVCKRIVNDGWRRFYNSNPQWNWCTPTFSITFDADGTGGNNVAGANWRYYMPDGFYGQIIDPFTYQEDAGYREINETTATKILNNYASGDVSGWPNLYALRPLDGDSARRWEIIVWPKPSDSYVITSRCRIYPNKLIELTDKPNAGFQFDEAIMAAVLAEAEQQVEDSSGMKESQWAEALTRAIAVDLRTTPKRLGDYGGSGRQSDRPYDGVSTYTNQDGTVHSF